VVACGPRVVIDVMSSLLRIYGTNGYFGFFSLLSH